MVIDTNTNTYKILNYSQALCSDGETYFYLRTNNKLSCSRDALEHLAQNHKKYFRGITTHKALYFVSPGTYSFEIYIYKHVTHKALHNHSNPDELLALITLQKQQTNNEPLNKDLLKVLKASQNTRIQEILQERFSPKPPQKETCLIS